MKYKIVGSNPNSSYTNIRADHSTASPDIGDFLNGHVAEGDVLWENADKTQKWLNILTVDGAPKVGWVAVIYNGQTLCTLTENAPPPPPTGETKPSSMDLVLHYDDGTSQTVNGIGLPDAT